MLPEAAVSVLAWAAANEFRGHSSRSTCVGDLDAASPGHRFGVPCDAGGEPRSCVHEELPDRGGAAEAGKGATCVRRGWDGRLFRAIHCRLRGMWLIR